jgi:curved DNA-binding protein CbpA
MKNYYEILGVSETAPREVIVAAYQALAKKLDPLKSTKAEDSGAIVFSDVVEAFSVLSSVEKRQRYNNELSASLTQTRDIEQSLESIEKKRRELLAAWDVALQFDRTRTLSNDYNRLLQTNATLAEEFQQLVVGSKLLESPSGYADQAIAGFYEREYGSISYWMKLFLDAIYSKGIYAAANDLKHTLTVIGSAVSEFEIMEVVANKHNLQSTYKAIETEKVKFEFEESRQREREFARLAAEAEAEAKASEERRLRREEAEAKASEERRLRREEAADEAKRRRDELLAAQRLEQKRIGASTRRSFGVFIACIALIFVFWNPIVEYISPQIVHGVPSLNKSSADQGCVNRFQNESLKNLCNIFWNDTAASCNGTIRNLIMNAGADIGSSACRFSSGCQGIACEGSFNSGLIVSPAQKSNDKHSESPQSDSKGAGIGQPQFAEEPVEIEVKSISLTLFQLQASTPVKCQVVNKGRGNWLSGDRFEILAEGDSLATNMFGPELFLLRYTAEDSEGFANFAMKDGSVMRVKRDLDFFKVELNQYGRGGKRTASAICG